MNTTQTPTQQSTCAPKTPLRTWLILGVAVAGLVAAAAYEALTTDRWGATQSVREAADRLSGVPTAFGDWTSAEVPQAEKVLKVAEAVGHVSRVYRNRKTGAEVSVLILCGASGPIGAHVPEYCYAGNGYEKRGDAQRRIVTVGENSPSAWVATYWSLRFEKKSPTTDPPLRVCYAWGTDGDWEAATNPRSQFALHPALYKLYAVRAELRELPPGVTDPIHSFLTDFLPEVKRALAPPAS
jgi:hypothetical protein